MIDEVEGKALYRAAREKAKFEKAGGWEGYLERQRRIEHSRQLGSNGGTSWVGGVMLAAGLIAGAVYGIKRCSEAESGQDYWQTAPYSPPPAYGVRPTSQQSVPAPRAPQTAAAPAKQDAEMARKYREIAAGKLRLQRQNDALLRKYAKLCTRPHSGKRLRAQCARMGRKYNANRAWLIGH